MFNFTWMHEYFASPVSPSRFFLSARRYCKLSPLPRRIVSSFYRYIFLLRWKSPDPEFLSHHTDTRIPWLQQFSYPQFSTVAALYHSLAERPQFYKKIKVLILDWQFITPRDQNPLELRLIWKRRCHPDWVPSHTNLVWLSNASRF